MQNTCKSKICSVNQDGDGIIPSHLVRGWKKFIAQGCDSVDCERRYTTKCCNWEEFSLNNK